MNMQFEVMEKKGNLVQVKINEETWIQLQNFLARQQVFEDNSKKGALKNIIPVMLNKFTKWLQSLSPFDYNDIIDINSKIKKIRNGKQNMSIRDLQKICENESIREYWISFLHNGHAIESINKMKNSTNKNLYERQINDLLSEVLSPKLKDHPYKNFISQTRNPKNSNQIEYDYNSTDQDIYQESYQVLSQSFTQIWSNQQ